MESACEFQADAVAEQAVSSSLERLDVQAPSLNLARLERFSSLRHPLLPGEGETLPASLQRAMAPRLGFELSGVRVYHDSHAAALTASHGARALTMGNRIAFNHGEYQPETADGRRLIAHELAHVAQQDHAGFAGIQFKKCNLYVYDSTQGGGLGMAWSRGTRLWALGAIGGYAVPSGPTIVGMLRRMLGAYEKSGCDCIEEIQFWCHGSSGVSMDISSSEQLTVQDFKIQGLEKFRDRPSIFAWMALFPTNFRTAHSFWKLQELTFQMWKKGLPEKSRLLVELMENICAKGAEVYYRSCETFQGKAGKAFAKTAADFWGAKVIGHTHVIGLSQPGKESVEPGEEPDWDDSQGVNEENLHILKTYFKVKVGKKTLKGGKLLLK